MNSRARLQKSQYWCSYATGSKFYKPQHLPTSWEAQQQKQDFVVQPEHWQDVSDSLWFFAFFADLCASFQPSDEPLPPETVVWNLLGSLDMPYDKLGTVHFHLSGFGASKNDISDNKKAKRYCCSFNNPHFPLSNLTCISLQKMNCITKRTHLGPQYIIRLILNYTWYTEFMQQKALPILHF